MAGAARFRGSKRALAVAGASAVLGASIVKAGEFTALAAPAILATLILLHLSRRVGLRVGDDEFSRRLMGWTIGSFFAHLFVASIITYGGLQLIFGPDASLYHTGAIEIVQHWNENMPLPTYIPAGKGGFYYLLAVCYWAFGTHVGVGLAVNSALAAAIVPIMTDVTHRLFGAEAARRVPPLIVLIPGLFLWTAQLLKEAPILFLMSVALYCSVRLIERISLAPLLGLAASFVTLVNFRAWVGLVLAAGLIAGLAFDARRLVAGLGRGLGALAVLALVTVVGGLGYSGYEVAVNTDLERANVVRQDLARSAASGIAPDADISTTRGAASYLVVGLPQFLLGPFPWQFTSVRQVPVLPDVILWWVLIPTLWRGIREARRHTDLNAGVLLVPAGALVLLLALGLGNFGTIVRERVQVVLLLVPLFALGLAIRNRRSSERFPAADASPAEAPTPAMSMGYGRP